MSGVEVSGVEVSGVEVSGVEVSGVEVSGDEVLMATYPPPPVTFVRGEGCRLYDAAGREYLDLVAGLAVAGLGHSHPAVAAAVAEQAKRLVHVSNLYANPVGPELARRIDLLIGGGHHRAGGRVFLANSGAEANECAIKLARRWAGAGRYVVVSALGSFHGRTLATLHATGQPAKHQPFLPLPAGFGHVPWGDLDALDRAASADDVAGLLLEPIQGEGGINLPPPGWLAGAREICDRHGILLMLDEVQTGLGRTGDWFAFQRHGIAPDVVTMAKALGNGVPIGACWARPEVAAAFGPGDHASTFGGQPLACSAALATLETLEAIDACGRSRQQGRHLRRALSYLDGVTEVRGEGLMLAAEVDLAPATAHDLALAGLDEGVVVNPVSTTALRFLPPLVIEAEEIDLAVERLARALGRVRSEAKVGGE